MKKVHLPSYTLWWRNVNEDGTQQPETISLKKQCNISYSFYFYIGHKMCDYLHRKDDKNVNQVNRYKWYYIKKKEKNIIDKNQ